MVWLFLSVAGRRRVTAVFFVGRARTQRICRFTLMTLVGSRVGLLCEV